MKTTALSALLFLLTARITAAPIVIGFTNTISVAASSALEAANLAIWFVITILWMLLMPAPTPTTMG